MPQDRDLQELTRSYQVLSTLATPQPVRTGTPANGTSYSLERYRLQRSSAFGHTQLGLGIVEVRGASRGKSPRIIEDLAVCTQLRRTTGAPTLSSEEPFIPFNCLCLVYK